MFSRMTIEQRLIVINAVLFVVAGVMAFLLVTEGPTLPEKPNIERIVGVLDHKDRQDKALQVEQVSNYEMFGEKNLFAALLPAPARTKLPPTPIVCPSFQEPIIDWKLSGLGPNVVFMRDLKQGTDIIIEMDDPDSVKRIVRFQNQDVEVVLESVDTDDMSATFSYTTEEGKHTVTKHFFEE